MTDKARELLKQIVAWWDDDKEFIGDFVDEIRAYLAEPEVKPLSASKAYLDGLAPEWRKRNPDIVANVLWGIRFAEQHHGIGDNNENTNT